MARMTDPTITPIGLRWGLQAAITGMATSIVAQNNPAQTAPKAAGSTRLLRLIVCAGLCHAVPIDRQEILEQLSLIPSQYRYIRTGFIARNQTNVIPPQYSRDMQLTGVSDLSCDNGGRTFVAELSKVPLSEQKFLERCYSSSDVFFVEIPQQGLHVGAGPRCIS